MENHYEKLAHLFLDGEEDEAIEFLKSLVKDHPRLYLYEDLITPAMYYIGELWENNEISVADEHLATGVCDYVLSNLDFEMGIKNKLPQNGLKAMLFGVEEEQHYIGLKMVANSFKDQGWQVRYLGPNLPLDHSVSQIMKYRPDVIGVSAALSYRLPKLKHILRKLSALEWQPKIIVGGRMAKNYQLKELESNQVVIIKNLSHLQQWFQEGKEGVFNETS